MGRAQHSHPDGDWLSGVLERNDSTRRDCPTALARRALSAEDPSPR
jgi:hypothetical protein